MVPTQDVINTPKPGAQAAEGPGNLGYKQELDRSLQSFAAFAAGFSYLSILTGIFQLFHEGFEAGGPAFFWTWPLVFVGQFLVALCFGELAAHYPLAGSVYQWSKYTGSWAVGWMTGWVYLASYIIALAAVVLALQTTLPQIAPWSVVGAVAILILAGRRDVHPEEIFGGGALLTGLTA